jgi:LEA14-like dessication related protein
MRARTIAAIIAVVIIVIAAAGAAFFLTLQAPLVESVKVSSIDNVTRSGFTFTFVIKLYNPNVAGVNVKSITYDLLLAENNQKLGNGTSSEFQVPARGSVEIPVQTTIYFSSVISAAFQTIFTKSVMMNLNGVATVQLPWSDVNVPFSPTFDGYPFISDAVSKIG